MTGRKVKKASELIREQLSAITESDLFCYADGAEGAQARKDALEFCLDLVEAQEREEQWTAFADKMPPAPTSNDDVLLVRFHKEYRHRGYYIEAMQRHVDGGHWVNHGLQDLTVEDYMSHDAHAEWRLITPPEAP